MNTSLSRIAALTTAVLALAVPSAAQATITPLSGNLSTGDFSQFTAGSVTDGTLTIQSGGYDGLNAAVATYSGDVQNGYSRAVENVSWSPTDDVWYGGAYYLPTGYLESLKGGNDILRWDNWGTYGSGADYGAIENWSDGYTRMILGKYTNDPGIILGQPFKLPEGRWFWLEVHEHFATDSTAVSQVYIDGQLVNSSTTPNTFGRGADRVRWGIVCIDAGTQNVPLTLKFSRATISSSEVGPLGSSPAPPTQPTPPGTAADSPPTGSTGSTGGSTGPTGSTGSTGPTTTPPPTTNPPAPPHHHHHSYVRASISRHSSTRPRSHAAKRR